MNRSVRRSAPAKGTESDEGVTDFDGFVEAAKKRYWNREQNVRTFA